MEVAFRPKRLNVYQEELLADWVKKKGWLGVKMLGKPTKEDEEKWFVANSIVMTSAYKHCGLDESEYVLYKGAMRKAFKSKLCAYRSSRIAEIKTQYKGKFGGAVVER